MKAYICPINKLRKNEVYDYNYQGSLNEPYSWFEYFLESATKENKKYILFQEEQEREFHGMDSDEYEEFWIRYNKKLIQKDVIFCICLSGYPKEKKYSFINKYSNIKIFNTPLYFLYFLNYLSKDIIYKLSNDIKNIKFNKLFISLNSKSHHFRCEMIDMLSEYNLLKYSEYSWLKGCEIADTFDFKYFDNKYKKLNYDSSDGWDYYWKDLLYGNPLINLVTESDDLMIGISEKTCKSILIGQPFIVYSQKGFHKVLQEFGFELYDEIFDYSFDSLDSPKDRMKGICDNLNNLKNKDLTELYNSISHKLEKNKQTALDIIKNKKFINKEYLELLINNKEQFKGEISTFNFFNLDN